MSEEEREPQNPFDILFKNTDAISDPLKQGLRQEWLENLRDLHAEVTNLELAAEDIQKAEQRYTEIRTAVTQVKSEKGTDIPHPEFNDEEKHLLGGIMKDIDIQLNIK